MKLQTWISGLMVLASVVTPAEALTMYDPQLCYILDGFLGLYGLFITSMFIKERFFKTKEKMSEDSLYSELNGAEKDGGYSELRRADPERGRHRKTADDVYTGLKSHPGDEYRELPVKKERQRKSEPLYQGLSAASRDTYDSLQMQPLPVR